MLEALPNHQLLLEPVPVLEQPEGAQHQVAPSEEQLHLVDAGLGSDPQHRVVGLATAQPDPLFLVLEEVVEGLALEVHFQLEDVVLQPVGDGVLHEQRKGLPVSATLTTEKGFSSKTTLSSSEKGSSQCSWMVLVSLISWGGWLVWMKYFCL